MLRGLLCCKLVGIHTARRVPHGDEGLIAATRYRNASVDTTKAVFESSVLTKIAYRGVLSGWSLAFSKDLDKLLV